jgi:hypothetical protein
MPPAEPLRRNQAASGWTGANPHGGSHCPDDVRAHGLFPHDAPHVDGCRVGLALRACEAEVGQRLVRVVEPQDQGAEAREEEPLSHGEVVSVADQPACDVDEADVDGEQGDELRGDGLEGQALGARVGDADRGVSPTTAAAAAATSSQVAVTSGRIAAKTMVSSPSSTAFSASSPHNTSRLRSRCACRACASAGSWSVWPAANRQFQSGSGRRGRTRARARRRGRAGRARRRGR